MKTHTPVRPIELRCPATNWQNTEGGYGSLSIGLHWLTLLLIAAVYACIELRGNFPKGSDIREGLKTWHFMLGLSILVLVLVRLAVHFMGTDRTACGRGAVSSLRRSRQHIATHAAQQETFMKILVTTDASKPAMHAVKCAVKLLRSHSSTLNAITCS